MREKGESEEGGRDGDREGSKGMGSERRGEEERRENKWVRGQGEGKKR